MTNKPNWNTTCCCNTKQLWNKANRHAPSPSKAKTNSRRPKNLFLLTAKPVLYVCNVDDTSAAHGNAHVDAVREAIKDENAELLIISAQTEADIAELESYEEKQIFLEDMGLKESGCDRLIKAIYHLLDLQTFITAGEMEVKA